MIDACVMCGRVGAVHAHHVTGRASPESAYFDGALTIPPCVSCHLGRGGIHQVLRSLGVEFLPARAHPVAHRLRRVALHAELLADAGRDLTFAPGAARGLALILREGGEVIDAMRADRDGAA